MAQTLIPYFLLRSDGSDIAVDSAATCVVALTFLSFYSVPR